MISYPVGTSTQLLVLTDCVIEHFRQHRQLHWWQRESGGQLFARLEADRIIVEKSTGPRKGDRRTRYSYAPNRKAEQQEIDSFFSQNLHYIGDWHSHAQRIPGPSSVDTRNIGECVRKSQHCLNGFVLIVVGREEPPQGLYVCVHDGHSYYELASTEDRAV
jgi:integrative and conjugative element protein (TIGR02256 family)